MRYLLGVICGATLGIIATITTQRYAGAMLWALFARGDQP